MMNPPYADGLFRTSDMNMAAYMLYEGQEIIRVEDWQGMKKNFVFKTIPRDMEKLASKYHSGKAKVEPQKFAMTLRSVKAMVINHNMYDQPEK